MHKKYLGKSNCLSIRIIYNLPISCEFDQHYISSATGLIFHP